jgi:hypothetical protein
MALYFSSNPNQTNFSVSGAPVSVGANRLHALPVPMYHRQDLGPVSVAIKPIVLAAPCISMAPTATGQTYTLPSAAQILQVFGRNLESGLSRVSSGTIIELTVVNHSGTFGATVAASGTGGSGTVVCPTGPYGKGTKVFVEFTSVSSGTGGCTGDYVVY